MGQSWTDEEYSVTDAAYQEAIDTKQRGGSISRSEVVEKCRNGLPERDPASIGPHLGNLTAARSELGLPILAQVTAFANRPAKLVKFLKLKYQLR